MIRKYKPYAYKGHNQNSHIQILYNVGAQLGSAKTVIYWARVNKHYACSLVDDLRRVMLLGLQTKGEREIVWVMQLEGGRERGQRWLVQMASTGNIQSQCGSDTKSIVWLVWGKG